jgi:hypothetical protein
MSLINGILGTGRRLGEAEAELVRLAPDDPRRPALSKQTAALQAEQTDQIAAALHAGVDEDTIRFALTLHGQGQSRDPWRTEPTPAEELLDLIQRHGGERVVAALDVLRAVQVLEALPCPQRPAAST